MHVYAYGITEHINMAGVGIHIGEGAEVSCYQTWGGGWGAEAWSFYCILRE